jgi:endonuclease III
VTHHPISGYSNTVLVGPRRASFSAFPSSLAKSAFSSGLRKLAIDSFFPRDIKNSRSIPKSSISTLSSLNRVQHPFARAAEMTHLANPELGACYGHLLVSFRMAIIEPECPVQEQHVESEEPEYRPGSEHQKEHAGYEAHQPEQDHENQKTDTAKRAMRRQRRRKDRGFKLVAVVGVHCAQYTGIMVKKPVRGGSARNRTLRPRKRVKVKAEPKQAAADLKAAAGELPQWTPAQIEEAFRRFKAANPEPKGELQHINPFTLLVAVVLSAQATDAGVNKATPALFALADGPAKMIALGEKRVRNLIKTIGLYRTKAKNVIALSRKLVGEHGGQVPRSREALEALPGVGRKTANVVLNIAFGEPTIAVDTHIFRVGNRTGIATGKTPFEVEMKLEQVVPAEYKPHAHHWLILHGRYTCVARRPLCEKCIISDLCQWPGKTVA